MNLIGLPGRNPETEGWLQTLLSRLDLGQRGGRVQHYRHWDSGGEPDVEFEASLLETAPEDLIIAKSMGTMVLLQAHALGCRPAAAVMIGVPLAAYDELRKAALRQFANEHRVLFIQQTDDVTGRYAAVAALLEGSQGATLAEVPGNDHMYSDVEQLRGIISAWAGNVLSAGA